MVNKVVGVWSQMVGSVFSVQSGIMGDPKKYGNPLYVNCQDMTTRKFK